MKFHTPSSQRGAVALIVTLVLFFVMTMVTAYAHRNHLFEWRASMNQVRATQAFEAAEAGLEWELAMLNDPRPVDEHCRPQAGSDNSFRSRHLVVSATTGAWESSGGVEGTHAACVRNGDTWHCACAGESQSLGNAVSDDTPAPAFVVKLFAGPKPGLLRLESTGCNHAALPCGSGATAADATARTQVLVGLVPALAAAPVATLTVRDDVDMGAASPGVHNADAATAGIAVHAGGVVRAPNARITTAPGGPADTALIEHDAALHDRHAERFFASFFGLDLATWMNQPVAARLACHGDCGEALRRAAEVHSLLCVDGDLQLDGTVNLGSPAHPLAIVATGAIEVHGQPVIHGVLYGRGLHWPGGGSVHGAVIVEGSYTGDGTPELIYDPSVLRVLMRQAGSYARLPGSWRDF
jgi:hypothetical protein